MRSEPDELLSAVEFLQVHQLVLGRDFDLENAVEVAGAVAIEVEKEADPKWGRRKRRQIRNIGTKNKSN